MEETNRAFASARLILVGTFLLDIATAIDVLFDTFVVGLLLVPAIRDRWIAVIGDLENIHS